MSRSVQRALNIIKSIANEPKGISEISRELEISKGTIFSLMKVLESNNFIKQDHHTQKYMLGIEISKMASKQLNSMDIVTVAKPHLQRLADDTGEFVNLTVRDHFSILFLLRVESRKVFRMLRFISRVGSNSPLHCTSNGKVILSSFSQEEFDLFVKETDFIKYTEHTITDPKKLYEVVQKVKENGYALNIEEYEEGLSSIAVPIFDSNGQIIASFNLAAPTTRIINDKKIEMLTEKLKKTAKAISADYI